MKNKEQGSSLPHIFISQLAYFDKKFLPLPLKKEFYPAGMDSSLNTVAPESLQS
jgi:hypothetical protein